MTERDEFEAWFKTTGQCLGHVMGWEAWKAGRASAIPPGYQAVPVTASIEMIGTGYGKITANIEYNGNDLYDVWTAMLEAAKEQPK